MTNRRFFEKVSKLYVKTEVKMQIVCIVNSLLPCPFERQNYRNHYYCWHAIIIILRLTTHVNILFSIYYFQLHIVALSSVCNNNYSYKNNIIRLEYRSNRRILKLTPKRSTPLDGGQLCNVSNTFIEYCASKSHGFKINTKLVIHNLKSVLNME